MTANNDAPQLNVTVDELVYSFNLTRDNIIIFPNPFTNTTRFSYRLKESSNISICIFSSQGQLVEVIEQQQAKGKQEVLWSSEGLPSGMYFYHIQADDFVGGGKMVKME